MRLPFRPRDKLRSTVWYTDFCNLVGIRLEVALNAPDCVTRREKTMKINRPGPNQPTPIPPPNSDTKKSNAPGTDGKRQNAQRSTESELSKVADHRGKTQSSRISKLSTNPRSNGTTVKPSQMKILINAAQSGKSESNLQKVVSQLKSGDLNDAKTEWTKSVGEMAAKGLPVDVKSLVNSVLRQAYVDTNEDLKNIADKVKNFNDMKKDIRGELGTIPGAGHQSAPIGSPSGSTASGGTDKQNPDDLIKEWEEKLQTLGDDSQLANIDLQNVLQKQQQTIQTLSNVSKMLHDTATSIIRKIG